LLLPAIAILAAGIGSAPSGCDPGLGTWRSEHPRAVAETTSTPSGSERRRSRLFPPRLCVGGITYLPDVSYSSETSFGLGGELLYPFRMPGAVASDRPSDVRLEGLITLEGQGEAEFTVNLYGDDARYGLKVRASYSDIPLRFYGIGPGTPLDDEEVYRPRSLRAYIEGFRKVLPHFRAGIRYEFEQWKLLETEQGGLLDTRDIRGSQGKSIFGAGLLLEWDTRDRRYSPTRGSFYQFFALNFDGEIGSQHDFNNYNLDLRNYFPVRPGHVLATQLFYYSARGAAPFWRYAALGGRAHTRGYRKGRYLDHILMAAQVEHRFHVWDRLELVGFAGLGEVLPEIGAFRLDTLRPSVGGGVRLRTGSADGVRARFDVGLGGRSIRLYLSLDEAF
jgi:hypothetical protein